MRELRISRGLFLAAAFAAGCGSTSPASDAGPDGGTAASQDGGAAGTGGGQGGGGGSSARDAATTTPTSCADLDCAAPATCDDTGAEPECFCPNGYDDVQGDGSLCRDIDECEEGTDDCGDLETCVNEDGTFTCMGVNECARAALNDCDANATCTDERDGFSCVCDAPWTGDGTTCTCPSGYTETSGECLADDGTACEDDDAQCLNGHCVGGVCCAQACDGPGTCETTNGATCADGSTCAYPTAPNGTTCDADANPCTMDQCDGGTCTYQTGRSCADTNVCTDSTCDSTDTTGDPCRHAANTAPCDDADPCTVDVCSNKVCDSAPLDCSDSDLCTIDSCDSDDTTGNPCRYAGVVCNDDGDECTDTFCDPANGCQISNNAANCDDGNPCTDNDKCIAGACTDTDPHVCDDADVCTDDDCDPLATGDPCFTTNNSDSCDDNDPCTTTDVCSAGDCTGSGNRCGPNADSCSAPSPPAWLCDCATNYIDDGSGYCVAETDQCLSDPCDANATCSDPTPNPGGNTESCDALCTCVEGYTGTGCSGFCADIDECAGDPCGIGDGYATDCTDGAPGMYSCQCAPGFAPIDVSNDGTPTCVCDMTGDFAMEIVSRVSWPFNANNNVDAGSMVETRSWALVRQSHLPDGMLTVEQYACGGTTPDLCQSVDDVAYNTYFPSSIWDLPTMPVTLFQFGLPSPLPVAPMTLNYVTPSTANLIGIHLSNPFGTWPSSRNNVGTSGNPGTNGSYWVNHDNDSYSAVSSFSVTTGVSPVCPRPGGGGNYPYVAAGGTARFHVASRAIATYEGDILTCDHIVGDVTGPASGEMQQNTRLQGCSDLCGFFPDFVDADIDPPPTVDDAVFEMIRIADGSDCTDVRAAF